MNRKESLVYNSYGFFTHSTRNERNASVQNDESHPILEK